MQWLIANMWMVLAAATVLGLLFGFSFRGLLASNKVRRAIVEREIAKTELTQAKAEVDALYAAQRKRKEESAQALGGDETLRTELDEREARIASLGSDLSAARNELEQLKADLSKGASGLETAAAATAGAVAGAVLTGEDEKELTELRDRNAWLEERVVALEADVSAAASIASDSAPTNDVGLEKLNWQTAYLRQRVDALEAKTVEQQAALSASAAVVAPAPEAEPEPDNDPAANAAADEEMARLRWRNRYLEGRLAYFEQSEEAEETVAETIEAPSPTPEPVEEPEAETSTDPEPEAEASEEPDTPDEAEPEPRASEAMLAELEGTQPEQIEKPSNGGDDLTAITGVGPRIAEVLNGLGIWTFGQIASWMPENETWIENHLSFKGRVSRENWVGQAKELVAA